MRDWLPPTNLTSTAWKAGSAAPVPPTAWFYEPQRSWHVVFQQWHTSKVENYDIYDLRGHLIELHANPSLDQGGTLTADWKAHDLTEDVGAPVADGYAVSSYVFTQAAWSHQPSQHVVYQGLHGSTPILDGQVHELWYTKDDGWNHHDLTNATNAPKVATWPAGEYFAQGRPFGFETKYDQTQRVVYFGHDNLIHHLYNHSGQWHVESIALPGGTLADGAGPTGYSFEGQETAYVLYCTGDGHVHEYNLATGGWTDLTMQTGAPTANTDFAKQATPVGYVFEDLVHPTRHVVYVSDAYRHIIELYWDATTGWQYNDLHVNGPHVATERTIHFHHSVFHLPPPLADSTVIPACYAYESDPTTDPQRTQNIIYMGDDNYVHQLLWSETDNVWHYNDLTSASLGSPKAASNSGVAAFVDTYHGTQNVYYVSDTRDIIELRWMPF